MRNRLNAQANAAGGGDTNARIDASKCRFCGQPATQREPIRCPSSESGMHLYIRI